ncbi:MAG: hypothetical protein IPJ77_23690 [Planctomycetes bacterium]|nr:hypothetical protein [Planctomycetota bacterium]
MERGATEACAHDVDARHATTRGPSLSVGRVRIELRVGSTTLDAVELELHAGSNAGAMLDAAR